MATQGEVWDLFFTVVGPFAIERVLEVAIGVVADDPTAIDPSNSPAA